MDTNAVADNSISFIWPAMLLSLLLVPLCIWLYLRLQQRRRRFTASYGMFGLAQAGGRPLPLSGAGVDSVGWRRHLPPALFLAGLTILLVAMARPQTVVSLPRQEGTVILTFDVSGSMAADDVTLPASLSPTPSASEGGEAAGTTRMELAKAVAREFVLRQPRSVRVGVVAFSDGGLAVQAPTDDQEAILTTIERLSPQRGTSVGYGILVALNTIAVSTGQAPLFAMPEPGQEAPPSLEEGKPITGTYGSTLIVLLSDGENNEAPDPLEAAQVVADMGVRLHTVGIGSTAGKTLEVEGFSVHTRLEEAALQQLAQLGGGSYYNIQNEETLSAVYDELDPRFIIREEKMEVTSLLAGAGIFIFLVGGMFSMIWFSRLP